MDIVTEPAPLRAAVARWHLNGERVALVPTMGNLHAGHLALVAQARALAERVVVSIFVNPLQFGPSEDFAAYPRTPDEDRAQLAAAGVDAVFMPDASVMYPRGKDASTTVYVPELTDILCGASRPGHFVGVATVVAKLFNLVGPDSAVFGEKDYQQLVLIRRMAADLAFPVEVIGIPTVREADGLAMSSRNQYLTPAERQIAPQLHATLLSVAAKLSSGESDFAGLEEQGMAALNAAGFEAEYVAVRRADDLGVPDDRVGVLRVLAAARLGRARLIDNLHVDRPVR
jgi:pantoate--beta-alanine ligase